VRLLVQIGLVALGSGLGGLARWGATVGAARRLGTAFPWGTFLINLSGSFFLGWFNTFLAARLAWPADAWLHADDLKLLVAVGFTGAYTTFSTFEYEADGLLRQGDGLRGALYLFGSMALGLVAVRCGVLLARWA
jgi:fluoride exporter